MDKNELYYKYYFLSIMTIISIIMMELYVNIRK